MELQSPSYESTCSGNLWTEGPQVPAHLGALRWDSDIPSMYFWTQSFSTFEHPSVFWIMLLFMTEWCSVVCLDMVCLIFSSIGEYLFCFVFCFLRRFLCVALAVLELALWTRLPLNSQSSTWVQGLAAFRFLFLKCVKSQETRRELFPDSEFMNINVSIAGLKFCLPLVRSLPKHFRPLLLLINKTYFFPQARCNGAGF